MNKTDLRKIYLEKRKNLAPAQRAEKSASVAERFFERFDLTEIQFSALFRTDRKVRRNRHVFDFRPNARRISARCTLAPRADFRAAKWKACV
jgi:hypothetical protein